MKYIESYKDLVFSLTTAFLLLVFLGVVVSVPSKSDLPVLTIAPESQDIYVIGNSMFGTGFSLQHARKSLPGKSVDFAYYNGHYSSMWHLAVTLGIKKDNAPDVIVWGFRPTYGIFPAFRQNKKTPQQEFSKFMNPLHRSILSNAGDPAYGGAKKGDKNFEVSALNSKDKELFERFGSSSAVLFKSFFTVLSEDVNVLDQLVDGAAFMVSSFVSDLGVLPDDSLFSDGKLVKPSDQLVRYTSGGRVQIADAQVIDNGEQFITGVKVPFSQSFLPHIANEVSLTGNRQLVVIFKPVSTFDGPLDDDIEQFYEDAVAYFEENRIPVLNLMIEPGLTIDMYAEGDHLNQRGRIFITDRILGSLK